MSTSVMSTMPAEHEVRPETLAQVRSAVKEILTRSPAYMAMPQEARRSVANDMVRVGAYLVDGERGKAGPRAATLADPPPLDTTAGADFGTGGAAVAARGGTQALQEEVNQINFPKFVSDLIHGTFDAIVTASIKQMDAYADLLKNVTKSVGQYAQDNISSNNARDYLAQQYPDHLAVDTSGDAPKLKPKDSGDSGGGDAAPMPDFMKDLGLPQPLDNLDEDTVEQTLVPAARERMAMDRQHLLATMVLMGINRLVVTDGDIEAKVLFQLDTKDKVDKKAKQATNFDDTYKYSRQDSGWFSPTVNEDYTSNFSVATTKSTSSTAEVDLHTKLSGQVSVHFKSETFPLDKMADIIGVDNIGGQAVGTGINTGAMPAGTGTGPPPLPSAGTTVPAAIPATTTPAAH